MKSNLEFKLKIIYQSKWYGVAYKKGLLVVQHRQSKKGVYMTNDNADKWGESIIEENQLGFSADAICKALFVNY